MLPRYHIDSRYQYECCVLFMDNLGFLFDLDEELAACSEHLRAEDPVRVTSYFSSREDVVVDLLRSCRKRRYLAEEEVTLACLSGRLAYNPYFIDALMGLADY